MEILLEEEDYWKCRKHPSHLRTGVCPTCLRSRLMRLCPDCANIRPCTCSSSSFASSSASLGGGTGVGAVGRVSYLIEKEPAFRRSRSAAFQFLRQRSVESLQPPPPSSENRRKSSFWSFLRSDKTTKKKKVEDKVDDERRKVSDLPRSRSVGAYAIFGGDVKLKGRSWYFPSPIKAFRHPKTANVVHQRSPLCRG